MAYYALLVWGIAYVLLRYFGVGATYDEIWTIQDFVKESYLQILNYHIVHTNNHILNTLLIKFFFGLFGESILIARLPSLLIGVLYFYFGWKITAEHISGSMGVLALGILISNPFLLDFIGLARGYGMSLSFMLGSIYWLLNYERTLRFRFLVWSNIFSALAVLSSLPMINYWIVCLGVSIFLYLRDTASKEWRNGLYLLFVNALLVAIMYEPIRKLMQENKIQFGGSQDFYHDTLVSLTFSSMYELSASSVTYRVLICAVLIFVGVLYGVKKDWGLVNSRNIVLVLTILIALSTVVQFYTIGTPYLIDRTALLFIPLAGLSLAFLLRDMDKQASSRVLGLFVDLMLACNFLLHANVYKTCLWFFDAHTEQMLSEINAMGAESQRML